MNNPIKVNRDFKIPADTIKTEYHNFLQEKKEEKGIHHSYSPLPVDSIKEKPKVEYKALPVTPEIKKQSLENNNFKKVFGIFFKIVLTIAIIILTAMSVMYINLLKDGKLTPSYEQNVSVNPITNNDYQFTPNTENTFENNYTIVNEISCPDVTCNCGGE